MVEKFNIRNILDAASKETQPRGSTGGELVCVRPAEVVLGELTLQVEVERPPSRFLRINSLASNPPAEASLARILEQRAFDVDPQPIEFSIGVSGRKVDMRTTLAMRGTSRAVWPPGALGEQTPQDDIDEEISRDTQSDIKQLTISVQRREQDETGRQGNWAEKFVDIAQHMKEGIRVRVVATQLTQDQRDNMIEAIETELSTLDSQTDRKSMRRKDKLVKQRNDLEGEAPYWIPTITVESNSQEQVLAVADVIPAQMSTNHLLCRVTATDGTSAPLDFDNVLDSHELEELFAVPEKPRNGLEQFVIPSFSTVGPEPGEDSFSVGNIRDNTGNENTGAIVGPLWARPEDIMNLLVTGPTGGGKTETSMYVLEQFLRSKQDNSAVIIAQKGGGDWRKLAARLREESGYEQPVYYHKLQDTENPNHISLGINLLKPAQGYSIKSHAEKVITTMLLAYGGDDKDARGLLQDCLSAALKGRKIQKGDSTEYVEGLLSEKGFDVNTGKFTGKPGDESYPTMQEILRYAIRYVEKLQYGPDGNVRENIKGFLNRTLGELGETDVFNSEYTIDPELLFKNVIFDTEGLGEIAQKLFFASIATLMEEAREVAKGKQDDANPLPIDSILFIEEANLATADNGSGNSTGSIINTLSSQMRKYGVTIGMAGQRITKLPDDAIANAGMVITTRTEDREDIEKVSQVMHLNNEDTSVVKKMSPGTAIAKFKGSTDPWRITIPDSTKRSSDVSQTINVDKQFINIGPSGELFTTEFAEATEMLTKEDKGRLLIGAVEIALLSKVHGLEFSGFAPLKTGIKDAYRELNRMAHNDEERRVLQCALEMSIVKLVNARVPELLRLGFSRTEMINSLYEAFWYHLTASEGERRKVDLLDITTYHDPYASDGPRDKVLMPWLGFEQIPNVLAREAIVASDEVILSDDGKSEWAIAREKCEEALGHDIPGANVAEQKAFLDRWVKVTAPHLRYDALIGRMEQIIKGPGKSERFPESEAWERTLGHPIPGENVQVQRDFLTRWQRIVRGIAYRDKHTEFIDRIDSWSINTDSGPVLLHDYLYETLAPHISEDGEASHISTDEVRTMVLHLNSLPAFDPNQNDEVLFYPAVEFSRETTMPPIELAVREKMTRGITDMAVTVAEEIFDALPTELKTRTTEAKTQMEEYLSKKDIPLAFIQELDTKLLANYFDPEENLPTDVLLVGMYKGIVKKRYLDTLRPLVIRELLQIVKSQRNEVRGERVVFHAGSSD